MSSERLITDIRNIIGEYMHPCEHDLVNAEIPTLAAVEYAATHNWLHGMDRALRVRQFTETALVTAAEHNDEAMALVLFEHREVWRRYLYIINYVVSTLTAHGHHLNQRDSGLDPNMFNRAVFNGSCRTGNLKLMQTLYTPDMWLSAKDAIQYNQFNVLKMLVGCGNYHDAWVFAIRYGRINMINWLRKNVMYDDMDLELFAIEYNQFDILFQIRSWKTSRLRSEELYIIHRALCSNSDIVIRIWNQSDEDRRGWILTAIANHDLQYRLF